VRGKKEIPYSPISRFLKFDLGDIYKVYNAAENKHDLNVTLDLLIKVSLLFIGLTVSATTNQEMRSKFFLCQKKTKWRTELPEGMRVPFHLQWGRCLRGGDGSFQVVCEQIWKSIWSEHKIIAWSLGPMKKANNYPNTVFVDVVSLCMRDLQKQCPPTVPT